MLFTFSHNGGLSNDIVSLKCVCLADFSQAKKLDNPSICWKTILHDVSKKRHIWSFTDKGLVI